MSLRSLLGREYYPLNKITVSKKRLIENYKQLSLVNPKVQIAPVLKSNAYGHGIVGIAKVLDDINVPMFCVDSLYEAHELYKARIETPILIMGYINPENLKVKKLPFQYAVYDINQLKEIAKYQPNCSVHLKIDTGMHRLGIPMSDLENFIKSAVQIKNIKIDGLMSHLATADNPNAKETKKQSENFGMATQILEELNIRPKWKHIAASSGLLRISKSKLAGISNLARIGLSLYGIDPDHEFNPILKPILSLSSQIVQIKNLNQGDFIGYSATFRAPKPMRVGVLPIGYNDGVDLRLSNSGYVKVKSKFVKILGRVSMNITAIDLTDVSAKEGDEVIIYSSSPQDKNSIVNASQIAGTIPYELLVHLSASAIRREVS